MSDNLKLKFQSNVLWPLDVFLGADGSGMTTDTHETWEEANAICAILREEGFGGQRKDFPLRAWVSEVQP